MHLLVLRFSAMGDVAMTAPVIHSLLQHHPDLQITFVSNGFYVPFFNKTDRFRFVAIETKGKHKGILGLKKLHKELKTDNFDAVVDLHDVLRSRILCSYFKLSKTKIVRIIKDRKRKRDIINGKQPLVKLQHTTDRYFQVFNALGLDATFSENPWTIPCSKADIPSDYISKKTNIGIAPFAKHEAKMWPISKMEKLLTELNKEGSFHYYLFGGGSEEIEKLKTLGEKLNNATIVAGNFDLGTELAIIKTMDSFISMDSSNMHLRCILGEKVVSLWGGTHPYLGFGPLNSESFIVQPDDSLNIARPSTIYGKVNQDQLEIAKTAFDAISTKMVKEKLYLSLT